MLEAWYIKTKAEFKSHVLLFELQDALLQHVLRAVYQAGIWTLSDVTEPLIPSPEEFAWTKSEGSWTPVWKTIPEVSRVCRELIKCSCKKGCVRCKCAKANLECTALCNCKCNVKNYTQIKNPAQNTQKTKEF